MTSLTYNGVALHNVNTTGWQQEPIMDDSGADQIGTKFILRFEGICHVQTGGAEEFATDPESPPFISVTAAPAGSATQAVQLARYLLEQSRKRLVVQVGGETLLVAEDGPVTGNNSDIDNGPKPKLIEITQIVGRQLFRVTFEIETSLADCGSGSRPFVLSNRWSVQETIDQDKFTTRTIRGRLRIASSEIPAHAYKGLCLPGLEPGFRRDRVDFTVTTDGLSADWEIADRQIHTAAPWPATRFEVFHSESTVDGQRFYSDCRAVLWGSPATDPRHLIQRGVQIIEARIQFLERITTAELLEGFEVAVITAGEETRVEVRGRISGPADTDAVARIHTRSLGQPLELPALEGHEYVSNIQEPPALYGENSQGDTAERSPVVLFLLSCPKQRFCGGNHQIAQGGPPPQAPGNTGEEPTDPGEVSARTIGATLPEEPPLSWSQAHFEAFYSYSRYATDYVTDENVVAMPIATGFSSPTTRTVNVFSLGGAVCHRVITVDVERIGALPQLPAPLRTYVDGNLTGTLKDHKLRSLAPTLTADGRKRVFRLKATYVYILNRPPNAAETVNVGVLPFTNFTQQDNRLPLGEVYSSQLGP